MFDLKGRRALVTGATGGIGAAIARALHAQGAVVVLSGTRENVLAERVAELGEGAFAAPCNLADMEAVKALPAQAAELAGGAIDILVNNAGITRDNIAMRLKPEDWQAVIDVNLTAAFLLSQGVMRAMMKQRFGRIINISSVVGQTGNAGQANYAAAKAGMIGFGKALAQELASRNITVNAIAPGFIETPMTEALSEQQREALFARIPAGRFGTPEDVAAAAVFLASEEAGYITGQTLGVNGGMVMC